MGTLSYYDSATGTWITTEDPSSGGGGVQLTDGSVITQYLADGAVTTVKLADGSVTNVKIVDLDAAKLFGVVNTDIIPNGSLTASKLAPNTITSDQLSSSVNTAINNAQISADSKNKTFYQTTMPAGSGYAVGDTWFDTDDGYKIYVWDGGKWNPSQDASIATAQQTATQASTLASGKNTIYYQDSQPTGGTYRDGDTWFDTNDNNKIYKYSGSSWLPAVLGATAFDTATNGALAAALVAVKSTMTEYAVGSSETVAPTTGWSTNTPTRTAGTFIWMRTRITYGDNSTTQTNPVLVTGNTGLAAHVHIAYATNATGTTGFSTTDSVDKTYVGMYVDNTPADSNDPALYAWTLIKGADGSQGIPGPKGADGLTPYLHIAYATNATGTTGFSTTDGTNKTYIGQYVDNTPADSNNPALYTWSLIQGPAGYTPVKGTDYFDGTPGQDGVSSYLWVRYATSAAGAGMTTNPTGMTYIGVATTTDNTAPTLPGSYSWSLIKGDQGIQGEIGPNGQTSYLHIKYSDNGTTFTANNGETPGAYIGTYVDFNAADSMTFGAYTWNRVKGDTGVSMRNMGTWSAGTAYVNNSSFIDVVTYNGATYMAAASNTGSMPPSANWTLIAQNGTNGTNGTDGSNGTNGKTYTLTINSTVGGVMYDANGANPSPVLTAMTATLYENGSVVTPATYAWTVPASGSLLSGSSSAASFTPTLAATFDPAKGNNIVNLTVTYAGQTIKSTYAISAGKVGTGGSNGSTYAMVLTGGVRNITYDANGANPSPAQTAWGVTLYRDGSPVTPTSYSWTAAGQLSGTSTAATFTPTASGTFGSTNTYVTLSVVHSGNTIIETAAVAVSRIGSTGTAGISISSITPYYLQQASAVTPAKPTLNPPGGSWTTTEPTYVAGTYLFRTDRVLYSNATFAYTDVSLVSSYTAASLAMTAANSKNTNYYQTNQPSGGTYIKGDTWFDTDDGNRIWVYNGSIWVDSSDTRIGALAAGQGNKVYYQTAQPTGGVYVKGDMWFDTDDNYKQYVYTGSGWQLVADVYNAQATANTAMTTANGKNKVVYSTNAPSGTGFVAGDTWYQYDASGIIKLSRYDGSVWTQTSLQDGVFGSIDAAKITTGYLSAARIAANAITGDKIAANQITAGHMVVGTITAQSGIIADAAITTAKIADLAVTNAKIGNLDAAKITTGTLDANRIGADTITALHIASNTITSTEMVAGTITAQSGIIADAAIVTAKIADGSITTAKIVDANITNAKIADLAVTDAKISTLSAGKINTGILSAARIGAYSLDVTKILVGDFTNLVSDGNFQDTTKMNWNTAGTVVTSTTESNKLSIIPIVGTVVSANLNEFQVLPGQALYAEAEVFGAATNTGTTTLELWIKYTKLDGTTSAAMFASTDRATASGRWVILTGTAVVPVDAKTGHIELRVVSNTAGGTYYWRNALARRRVSGSMIVDGSITTSKLAAGSITADSGIIASIDASKITTGVINAALIQTIPAEKISGTIYGSQLDPQLGSTIDISTNASVTQKADATALDPINQQITNLNNNVTNLTNSVKIDSAGILIQQNSLPGQTQFAIRIDGDSMDFLENNIEVAKITSQVMSISAGKFTGSVIVGAHEITRSGEQTVFRWVG